MTELPRKEIERGSATETLMALAEDANPSTRLYSVRSETESPDWQNSSLSWPGYVPEEVREVWQLLPIEAQLIAVILASELASRAQGDWQ